MHPHRFVHGSTGAERAHVVEFDPSRASTLDAVTEAVATANGVRPTTLGQVPDYVDPDALDRLVDPRLDRPPSTNWIAFEYAGMDVVVASDARIVVRNPD